MVDFERPFKITKCSNEDCRDWSNLPLDILQDISSRLMIFDSYSFSNVCTSWRSAKAPLSPQMPFLFLRKNYFSPKPFCKLLNLANNLSDNVHMPILGGKVCIGSQYGWLILIDNTVDVISLYNPFSQIEIKLPSHAHLVNWFFREGAARLSKSDFISKYNFKKVVLSCPPISSTGQFLTAAALFDNGDLMYKRGGEYDWKLFLTHRFQDITSWRGTFVGVTPEGRLYKLNLDEPELKIEHMRLGSYDFLISDIYNKCLVNLDDNLLQVLWHIDTQNTITVKVMQLGLEPLTRIPSGHLWIPVNDLHGHSLFLGNSHSFSLSSQHIPGLKDNLIYFIKDKWVIEWTEDYDDYNDSKRDISVFDMRNGTYEICTLPNTPFSHSTSAFWYAPPLHELWNQPF